MGWVRPQRFRRSRRKSEGVERGPSDFNAGPSVGAACRTLDISSIYVADGRRENRWRIDLRTAGQLFSEGTRDESGRGRLRAPSGRIPGW